MKLNTLFELLDELKAKQQKLLELSKELEQWKNVATTDAYKARVEILDNMKTIIKDAEKINKEIERY